MMTKSSSLASSLLLAFAATAAGCAADVTAPPGDGSDGSGSGSGSNDPGPVPTTMVGKYAMSSEFDLATNMPGTAGTVVNIFISATDDPDDPTKFIVEKLVDALPDGSVKDNLRSAIPFVAGYLNDRLLEWAPDLVTKVVALGNGFGQMTHHFGLTGSLEIGADNKAKHVFDGFHFKIDQNELDFPFADYNVQPITASGVSVALSTSGKISIDDHQMSLPFGAALRIGLDEMIIPLIDPNATSVADVLHDAIDCSVVGQDVYDAVGFGSPSTFESACNAGLNAAGTFVYSEIAKLDQSALKFHLNGSARGVDNNKDGAMDVLQTGVWLGKVDYAGTPADLPAGAKFRATRM